MNAAAQRDVHGLLGAGADCRGWENERLGVCGLVEFGHKRDGCA